MGSSIIEVGIGSLLVYLLLSVLVSQINNIIKNALNMRGDLFRREIERLLQDPRVREAVLSNPAVTLLTSANEGTAVRNISAELLADVLIDVLAGNGETLEMLENLTNTPLVEQIVAAVEDQTLKDKLRDVLKTARNLADVKEKLAQWLDIGLSRAREVYGRHMQVLSFICGAVLVLLLNVDTIYIAESLWNDPVLRQATVDAANTTISQVDPGAETQDLQESIQRAQNTMNNLLDLRLPIGWYHQPVDEAGPDLSVLDPLRDTRNLWNVLPGGNPGWFGLLVEKLVGLLLTTIAVMQGAPFWFDLLRRATGRN